MRVTALVAFASSTTGHVIGRSEHNALSDPLPSLGSVKPNGIGSINSGTLLESIMNGASSLMPQIKPVKTVQMPPKTKTEGAKRIEIWYGPLKALPAVEAAKSSSSFQFDKSSVTKQSLANGFPLDSTILTSTADLRFEDSKKAELTDGIYNHHVSFMDITKKSVVGVKCPEASTPFAPPPVVVGAGSEFGSNSYAAPNGTIKSGYYLGKENKIYYIAEIINYSNKPRDVYTVVDFEYIPGRPQGYLDSSSNILMVAQCDGFSVGMRPPAGQLKWNYKSKEMVVIEDGYISYRRGHLHDGGENIIMKLNEKEICDSKAIYEAKSKDAEGKEWVALSGMTECVEPVEVRKGDKIRVEAYYDLEKHPSRKFAGESGEHRGHGGMGGMGGMGEGDAEQMGIMAFNFSPLSSKA